MSKASQEKRKKRMKKLHEDIYYSEKRKQKKGKK